MSDSLPPAAPAPDLLMAALQDLNAALWYVENGAETKAWQWVVSAQRALALLLEEREEAAKSVPAPAPLPASSLYDVARHVTDEVLGEGAYAEVNASNPDPGVQAAIRRS